MNNKLFERSYLVSRAREERSNRIGVRKKESIERVQRASSWREGVLLLPASSLR